MTRKRYLSNWLYNTSVAAIIAGGFQQIGTGMRLLALGVAALAFFLGYVLARGD